MSIITERIEERNVETVPLRPLQRAEPRDMLIGALLVIGGALGGWIARAAFLPYDYYQLAWLVPLVTFFIVWSNAHATDNEAA